MNFKHLLKNSLTQRRIVPVVRGAEGKDGRILNHEAYLRYVHEPSQIEESYKNSVLLRGNILLFLFFLTVTTPSCAQQKKPQFLKTAEIRIERQEIGAVSLKAELAKTEEERAKGLMFRNKLKDGKGMLFIFDREQPMSFWMENTRIPLSIAFIATDGRIVEIKDMKPNDRSLIKSSRSVRYALEVPQGWFDRVNVKPGDTVIILQ